MSSRGKHHLRTRLLALLLTLTSTLAHARGPSPDEAWNLRVGKGPGTDRLTWDAPAIPPDRYQVRRCVLPSLRNRPSPYYGNCVAQGLTATSWEESVPGGNVFYLVSGRFAGVEGSIGQSFDGQTWNERIPVDCATPWPAGSVTLDVFLEAPLEFCGSQIDLKYPAGAVSYASSTCTDLTAGFLGQPADFDDHVRHACVSGSLSGPTGPGVITRLVFDRGNCPVPDSVFKLVTCDIVDCTTLLTTAVPCSLR